jgi:DNA-binding beta-propeller fold protein YncE
LALLPISQEASPFKAISLSLWPACDRISITEARQFIQLHRQRPASTWRFSNDGGLATDSSLNTPRAAAIDLAGNLYIADSGNDRVRRVDSRTQIIQTVAGNGNRAYSGDGGPATAASLNFPRSVAIAQTGALLILDSINQRLRLLQLDTGIIRTIAGNGVAGFSGDNEPADKAMVWTPSGVAVDAAGNVLIADTVNQRIRGVRVSSQ